MVIAGVIVGLFLGLIVGPPVYRFVQLAIEMPADDDRGWAGKTGWRLCNRAIAAWSGGASLACWKLAICDNEGALSAAEHARLEEMLRQANCQH
jgi:hypothetical protein